MSRCYIFGNRKKCLPGVYSMIGRGIGIPFRHGTSGGGTSIPPEIKKSIVAWYDPKKQGMTNYDVIEAYTEDFRKEPWINKPEKYVGNLTSKTLTVTEVIVRSTLIYTNIKPYNFKVRITGLINNQKVIFGDDTSQYRALIVDKDGIYDINWEDNHNAYCIWMDFIGECDITITQLPTSILKDFSGNKHDAYLYGFKGKLNSGVGIYAQDFKNWNYGGAINSNISTKFYNKFHIVKKKADNWFGFTIGIPKTNYYNQSYKLKFNINKKIDDIKFTIVSTDGNLITTAAYSVYINDGSIIDVPIISEEIFNNKKETNIYYDFGTNKDIEIDVELIADYPNQLCYDGKSYAVAYDMPILTDYTVMAERAILDNSDIADWAFIAKRDYPAINGAFTFEKDIDDTSDNLRTISFGRTSVIYNPIKERSISYQTKNKYNGQDIIVGNVDDVDFLLIGAGILDTNLNLVKEKMRVAHGAIIVADRSFTEEEINWLKQNWDKI